jgi:hypothetical protein
MSYFEPGSWNAVCSMCGRERKSSRLIKNWQGQWRCPEHNEPRHPQDFVRPHSEEKPPAWTQNPSDTFVVECTLNGVNAIADYGTADCAISDFLSPSFDPSVTN